MHQPVGNESIESAPVLLIFKLANCETVVGKVVRDSSSYIDIVNPYKLATIINSKGKVNLTLMHWEITFELDFAIRIFKSNIVACGYPTKALAESYEDLLKSGFDNKTSDDDEEDETDESVQEDESTSKITNKLLH